jgi:4-amino-4-deoxy-L-arabinose transferase-like glycosyltransferase
MAEMANPRERHGVEGRRVLPALVAIVLALGVWAAHLPLIDAGGFRIYDEFHTLDRSASFAEHGTWWVVHSLQEPSFRKPPLQYWMGAGLLETGLDPLVALRLPSMLFALLCLGAVGLLAVAVLPGQPWAIPASILLFSGSLQFWQFGLSAMLETGAAGFATLALAAAILATRRPLWWYVCAAAIVLGALQKAPIGLVLVALYLWGIGLSRRWHGMTVRGFRQERAFRVSLRIALAGAFAWPVLQTVLFGAGALQEFVGQQMLERFVPAGAITRPRTPGEIRDLIIVGEPVLRWLGAAAVLWLPWRLGRMDLLPLPFVYAAVIGGIILAAGHVTDRYALSVLPLACVALAGVLLSLAPRLWIGLAAVALVSAASFGPVKTRAALALAPSENYANQMAVLSEVGAALRPEETLVVCTRSGEARIVPALSSHFAANGRPYVLLDSLSRLEAYRAAGRLGGPLRGLCKPEDLALFAPHLAGVEVVAEYPPYVMWRAEGDAASQGLPSDPAAD